MLMFVRRFLHMLFFDYQFSNNDLSERYWSSNNSTTKIGIQLSLSSLFSLLGEENSIFRLSSVVVVDDDIQIEIISLELMFWLKSFLFLSLQSFINAIVAVIVYKLIVEPNKKGVVEKKKNDDLKHVNSSSCISWHCNQPQQQHLLLVYGILCPILLGGPLYIFSTLMPELSTNITLMLCCCGAFPILIFRILETLYGQIPNFAIDNIQNFILYYGATLSIKFCPIQKQPQKLTMKIFMSKLQSFIFKFVLTSLLYSMLIPYNYKIAPEKSIQHIIDLYYWGNIINAYMMAALTSLLLDAGASGLGLLQSLGSGYVMESFHDNPLTLSTSPSDFWSNRWDRPVQSALRNGIYRPLVKSLSSLNDNDENNDNNGKRRQRQDNIAILNYYSKHIAAFSTFIVSGILHEYVLYFMSFRRHLQQNHDENDGYYYYYYHAYKPTYGHHMLFFLWNGIILLLERMIVGKNTKHKHNDLGKKEQQEQNLLSNIVSWIQYNLPRPIQTMLVLLLVLPISHLFTDEYIKSSFYDDASFGFPILVIRTASSP